MEESELDTRSRILQITLDEIPGEETCCVICLQHIAELAIAKPCQHQNFDFICLVTWLEEQPVCPLCKVEVKTVQYGFSDNDPGKIYTIPNKPPATRHIASTSQNHRHSVHVGRPYGSRPRYATAQTPPPTVDEALRWRRQVYCKQLFSLHVGSNRVSRFKELTPQLCRNDAELLSRARMWIRRELQVFEFLTPAGPSNSSRIASNAEFLLEYIVAILKTVDLQASGGQAENMLQDFIGRDNARLFLHEMRAWLRSPFTSLADWDRNVQYDTSVASARRSQQQPEQGRDHNAGEPQSSRTAYKASRRRRSYSASQRSSRPAPYNPRLSRRIDL